MKGFSLTYTGAVAGIIGLLVPCALFKHGNIFLLVGLTLLIAYGTGNIANKKYNSLLSQGSINTPFLRMSFMLGVFIAQIALAALIAAILCARS